MDQIVFAVNPSRTGFSAKFLFNSFRDKYSFRTYKPMVKRLKKVFKGINEKNMNFNNQHAFLFAHFEML